MTERRTWEVHIIAVRMLAVEGETEAEAIDQAASQRAQERHWLLHHGWRIRDMAATPPWQSRARERPE